MNTMKKLLYIVLLLSTLGSYAQIIEVKQNGTGDFSIIQEAIDFAQNGDTVLVWPGIYYENLDFKSKGLVLASLVLTTGDEDYKYNTIIDGGGNTNCIRIRESLQTGSVVGFSIRNGIGDLFHLGGGINIFMSNAKVIGNIIYGNKSRLGGGIGCTNDSYIYLSSNSILDNHAYGMGGGMYIAVDSYTDFDSINRNSIYNNFATRGCDICISTTNNDNIDIFLDTCTVISPVSYFISLMNETGYELDNLEIDILNSIITPRDSDLYVNPISGDNNNSGISPDEPLRSIAWAYSRINVDSIEKNTIHLANGIYSDSTNNEKFPLNIRPFINVIGQNRDSVILDGNRKTYILGGNNCVSDYSFSNMTLQRNQIPTYEVWELRNTLAFLYRQNHRFVLDNIVFKDSYAKSAYAILTYFHADSSIVRNCVFTDNKGGYGLRTVIGDYGLGSDTCFCGDGDIQYIENTIFNNHQPDFNNPNNPVGNAVTTGFDGTNIIQNCLFSDNTLTAFSQVDHGGNTYLVNCTFYNNSETEGTQAIGAYDGNINMYNCISYNNHDMPIRIGVFQMEFMFHSHLNIFNSLIEGGEESIFIDPACYHHDTLWCHLHYDSTNIDADPVFLGMWGDPYMIADGSPCIDAGTLANLPDFIEIPEFDLAGNPRIVGDSIDMGAYEWNPTIVGFNEIGPGNREEKPKLLKASPNPFDWGTYLSVEIENKVEVKTEIKVEIYDNLGILVRNILSTTLSLDEKILWSGDDNNGNPLPAGIYHVVMFYGEREVESLKVVKR